MSDNEGLTLVTLAAFIINCQAFSLPSNQFDSRNPVYEPDRDSIPDYEVLELSPAELDSLLEEVHSPAVDHILYPNEYDWEDNNQEDAVYPGYYPLTLPDYYEDAQQPELQLQNLGFQPRFRETNQNLIKEVSQSDMTTSAPSTTTASTTTTATARPLRIMTKERRGMVEKPIFRPGNAKDPHFMYRGRKKRSVPLPPFVSKTNKSQK